MALRELPPFPADPPRGAAGGRPYAPETQLLPGVEPVADDPEVLEVIRRLPDGSGALERVGICTGQGSVYREVLVHGQVQLTYLWAGLNALGFAQQRPVDAGGFSKYRLLFARKGSEKWPHEAAEILPSG